MKYTTLMSHQDNKYCKYIYRKLYGLHHRTLDKCDNPDNIKYATYGGRGVTYQESWYDTNNFIHDVLLLDGFNAMLFIRGKLSLDKDIKVPNSKLYSKETCSWVLNDENEKYKTSRWHTMYAYNFYKDTLYIFNRKNDFRKRFNLLSKYFGTRNTQGTHSGNTTGWIMWNKEYKVPNLTKYTYYSPNGLKVVAINQSELVRQIPCLTNTIISRTAVNTTKKLKQKSIITVTNTSNYDTHTYTSDKACADNSPFSLAKLKRLFKDNNNSFHYESLVYNKNTPDLGKIGVYKINPFNAKYIVDMQK